MNRAAMYRRVQGHPQRWDMIVVGGGATGVGTAIDDASRGYGVLLLDIRRSIFRPPSGDLYFTMEAKG